MPLNVVLLLFVIVSCNWRNFSTVACLSCVLYCAVSFSRKHWLSRSLGFCSTLKLQLQLKLNCFASINSAFHRLLMLLTNIIITNNLLNLRGLFQSLNLNLKRQLSKIDNSSLNITHSARINLGFIFDEHLTFSDQISSLSKSCYSYIRQLRCIRPYLDSKTASTIAVSIVHSKLDYTVSNSLIISYLQLMAIC